MIHILIPFCITQIINNSKQDATNNKQNPSSPNHQGRNHMLKSAT